MYYISTDVNTVNQNKSALTYAEGTLTTKTKAVATQKAKAN